MKENEYEMGKGREGRKGNEEGKGAKWSPLRPWGSAVV